MVSVVYKLPLYIGKLLELIILKCLKRFPSACAEVKKCLYYAATYIYTYRATLVALTGVLNTVEIPFPSPGTCQVIGWLQFITPLVVCVTQHILCHILLLHLLPTLQPPILFPSPPYPPILLPPPP